MAETSPRTKTPLNGARAQEDGGAPFLGLIDALTRTSWSRRAPHVLPSVIALLGVSEALADRASLSPDFATAWA